MEITVGQEVVVVGIGNNSRYSVPIQKAIVTKVGRKWFYISTDGYTGRDNRFNLECRTSDGKGYMPEWRVYRSEKEYYELTSVKDLMRQAKEKIDKMEYAELVEFLK